MTQKKRTIKDRVRARTYYLVKIGAIHPPKICEICGGDRRLENHHETYENPEVFSVLCGECHRKLNRRSGSAIVFDAATQSDIIGTGAESEDPQKSQADTNWINGAGGVHLGGGVE